MNNYLCTPKQRERGKQKQNFLEYALTNRKSQKNIWKLELKVRLLQPQTQGCSANNAKQKPKSLVSSLK